MQKKQVFLKYIETFDQPQFLNYFKFSDVNKIAIIQGFIENFNMILYMIYINFRINSRGTMNTASLAEWTS